MREIRRAEARFLTPGDGVTTRHSFAYGAHYDPDNVGFGPLIAINTETLEPGQGYDVHRHTDVDIITWVLEGALDHEDSTGQRGVITPGTAQRLSAGTGVEHTERNASDAERLVFVQMMVVSDHGGAPAYGQAEVDPPPGELTPTVEVAAAADLFVLRLGPGESATVPAAPRSLLHVTRGSMTLDDTLLTSGDEARLSGEDAYDLNAADDGGEALIWQLWR